MEEASLSLGDKVVLSVLIVLYTFNILIHAYFIAMIAGLYKDEMVLIAYIIFFGFGLLYALLILAFNVLKKVKGVIFENYMFLFAIYFLVALWLENPLWNLLGILQVIGILISILSIRLLYKGLKSTGK